MLQQVAPLVRRFVAMIAIMLPALLAVVRLDGTGVTAPGARCFAVHGPLTRLRELGQSALLLRPDVYCGDGSLALTRAGLALLLILGAVSTFAALQAVQALLAMPAASAALAQIIAIVGGWLATLMGRLLITVLRDLVRAAQVIQAAPPGTASWALLTPSGRRAPPHLG